MIKRLDQILEKTASSILVCSLVLMLLLPVLNIIARWFQVSFLWTEPLLRHLVLLSAFMGAILATGRGSHIKIDLVSRALEAGERGRLAKAVKIFVGAVSFLACFFLARAGYDLAKIEFEFGTEAMLGIHSGVLVSIIPFGFTLLGARFLTVLALATFSRCNGTK